MRPDLRPVCLAGNWKMNFGPSETREFLQKTAKIRPYSGLSLIVAPPAVSLSAASQALDSDSRVALGAQNIHWELAGAFTGEIAGPMLKELGVTHVIVGHSERRHIFLEDDALVGRRLKGGLEQGFTMLFCIGETLEERESGRTEAVLERQIRQGLKGIEAGMLARLVVAYEPVWAIGTGKTATAAQAQSAQHFTRNLLADAYNARLAQSTPILYGGSVKPDNIASLLAEEDVDGALVGGASINAASWMALVEEASKVLEARKV